MIFSVKYIWTRLLKSLIRASSATVYAIHEIMNLKHLHEKDSYSKCCAQLI